MIFNRGGGAVATGGDGEEDVIERTHTELGAVLRQIAGEDDEDPRVEDDPDLDDDDDGEDDDE